MFHDELHGFQLQSSLSAECRYTCMYTCIYTCLCTCLYTCSSACLDTCPHTCPHIYRTHVRTHAHTHMSAQTVRLPLILSVPWEEISMTRHRPKLPSRSRPSTPPCHYPITIANAVINSIKKRFFRGRSAVCTDEMLYNGWCIMAGV